MKLRYKHTAFLLFWIIGLIAQTPQTITFPDIPVKGYGDVTFTLNATASSGLAVRYVSSDVTVATVSGSTVTIKKTGTFTVISAYQDSNATYAPATPVPQLLVVCPKATLTVTAADKTIDSGSATPAFTYNITGYKNSETASVVSERAYLHFNHSQLILTNRYISNSYQQRNTFGNQLRFSDESMVNLPLMPEQLYSDCELIMIQQLKFIRIRHQTHFISIFKIRSTSQYWICMVKN